MYKIAGIVVDMNLKYPRLIRQSEAYKCEDQNPDIKINFPDGYLEERQKENPHLSIEDCEYIWAGSEFYELLPEFGCIPLQLYMRIGHIFLVHRAAQASPPTHNCGSKTLKAHIF